MINTNEWLKLDTVSFDLSEVIGWQILTNSATFQNKILILFRGGGQIELSGEEGDKAWKKLLEEPASGTFEVGSAY